VTVFCFGVLFWIALPRNLGALRYTSLASIAISIILVIAIGVISFSYKEADQPNQEFGKRIEKAVTTNDITVNGIFSSTSLVIFSYMYQPNIPAIHHELLDRSIKKMDWVMFLGTLIASIAYFFCGFFGYATFANNIDISHIHGVKGRDVDTLMSKQNILADYPSDFTFGLVLQIGVLVMILFASPFCILPSKDSLEQLLLPQD
jgi:hypothetical protein